MVRLNIAMLKRGLSVGTQELLTVSGRKSGEPRQTPVSISQVDGQRYIVAAIADANWVSNVRAAKIGTLGHGSNNETVSLTELPVGERGPVLRAFLEQVRRGRRFFGSKTPDEVVEGAASYPVFRVDSA